MESVITTKGQATIPKTIREHLRLKPGDRVKFFIHSDGTVILLPSTRVSSLRGLLNRRQRRVAVAEMDAAIAAGMAERAGVRGRSRGNE